MKKISGLLALVLLALSLQAQTYRDSLIAFQKAYKNEFLKDKNSPLKAKDTGYISFFAPDENFRTLATITPSRDTVSFMMPTHNGKLKRYRTYGTALIFLNGSSQPFPLEIYQSMDLLQQDAYKDYRFLPFNDATNGAETYGGGRYLDFSTADIQSGKLVIDFNKAYNPYCAYADGYSCPIPPPANRLPLRIEAGERSFGKKH